MGTRIWIGALFLAVMGLWATPVTAAEALPGDTVPDLPPAPDAPERINPIHPLFAPLDADGQRVIHSGKALDTRNTCGACHDVDFIHRHDGHAKVAPPIDCLSCHAPGGRLAPHPEALDEDGVIRREWMEIGAPGPQECAACHGLAHVGEKPLTLPDGFTASPPESGLHPFHQTLETGAIFSPQRMRDSYLNLADKERLRAPWDVHAGRLLTCTACHVAANNPKRPDTTKESPAHLRRDPRRLSTADYLRRPDHRLVVEDCRSCHDPMAAHDFLPYRQRHFERVSCQACHVPEIKAPLLASVDLTAPREDGGARVLWRNVQGDEATPINARYVTGFVPYLFPYVQAGQEQPRLTPVNVVTRWQWIDAADGVPVSLEQVRKALEGLKVSSGEGGGLRTEGDVAQAAARLRAAGVRDPQIKGISRLVAVNHGIQGKEGALRDCTACHGRESRLGVNVLLDNVSVGGLGPVLRAADGSDLALSGTTVLAKESGAWLYRNRAGLDYYLLGHDRAPLVDTVGFVFFLLTVLGVAGHAARRVQTRHLRPSAHRSGRRVYLYTVYERLWHWLMAASILLLLLTGFEIHFVSGFAVFGFANAVSIHNVLAFIMVANAFLSLFYHLASTDIRQYIPRRDTLVADVLAQVRFYLNGIFVGALHPGEKSRERKLNPLQQITYMGLLNVLIPFQVITGALMWGVGHSPELSQALGGIAVLAPLHTLGSWFLLSFVTAHLYLITTGHTLGSNLKAMVHGYDLVDVTGSESTEHEEADHAQHENV